MSPSGRFQSNLFNFVSQQTQKLADKIGVGVRHLKVGTTWGVQILLYPVYALFQSTRLVGRQLQQTIGRAADLPRQFSSARGQPASQPLNAPLTVDTPIQRVLAAIRGSDETEQEQKSDRVSFGDRLLAVARFWHITLSQPPLDHAPPRFDASLPLLPIQGIASLLPTGKLVLVTIDNQIMDVLTLKQQEQIRQRLVWELASYWRYRRQHIASSLRLPPIEDRAMLLPPVRLFRQLMAWVQTSPVAIAADLFQESALTVQPTTELVWFAPTITLPTFDPTGFSAPPLPTKSDFKRLIKKVPTIGEMEALIWAAVRYFFGQGNPKSSVNRRIAAAPDPWLAPTDVFGAAALGSGLNGNQPATLPSAPSPRSLSGQSARAQMSQTAQPIGHLPAHTDKIPGNSRTRVLPFQPQIQQLQPLRKWIHRYLSPRVLSAQPSPAKRSSHSENRQSASRSLTQVKPKATAKSELIAPPQAIAPPVFKPDWIDTPATPIGYVQSPLERIIGWLDNCIAWIEKTAIAVWNWLFHRR